MVSAHLHLRDAVFYLILQKCFMLVLAVSCCVVWKTQNAIVRLLEEKEQHQWCHACVISTRMITYFSSTTSDYRVLWAFVNFQLLAQVKKTKGTKNTGQIGMWRVNGAYLCGL